MYISKPGLVEAFEKSFSAVEIPYPEDTLCQHMYPNNLDILIFFFSTEKLNLIAFSSNALWYINFKTHKQVDNDYTGV